MSSRVFPFVFVLFILCLQAARAAEAPQTRSFQVDGVARQALVYAPGSAQSRPTPLVFGWHGHGGNMANAARSYRIHELWPEAIVVYPQGLNTPGKLTDPEGKRPGWQSGPGAQGDRDLKFFDTLLAALRADYRIDAARVYATGHSNGGGFTYLLWAMRRDTFAAFAPSAAAFTEVELLKPMPVLHIAGEADPLVKYAWQQLMMEALRKLNQCAEGQAWGLDTNCTLYPSKLGAPVITAIHPGTHKYPEQAPEVIVKFFKSQVKAAR
ncbi:MAG: alpha/beta hydrolase family esterase [Roseimicrobium sp.]